MDYSASSIATRQKGKRVLRRFEAFNSTILVYDASIPVRHKATIPHFLDLMRRPLSNAELGRRLGAFISQRCRSLGKLSFRFYLARNRAILHQGQRGGEERVAMPPVTDPGPLSNQSQCRTNESPGPLALQKRKLENFELRLRGETRAFRPANKN